ncbi:twin-arginine translocase subunit TatC [Bifidobacterium mongoliense]|uniref:twin-arginine translocase subunit TatC n=1 Tax=Bifidobacterium mongoliense TaxID=518643 RepID=UPI0030EEA43E
MRKTRDAQRNMGVLDHLRELRKRLLWTLPGIFLGCVAGWYAFDPVLSYLQRLLASSAGRSAQLNFQTIGGALDLKFNVAMELGMLISSPWWILQIGIFLGPGLRQAEKRYVAVFGIVGIILFLAGAYTGLRAIPEAVVALNSFVPANAAILLQASTFVDFCMKLIFAFGLSVLVPEILVALNFIGVLKARVMLKAWRWAVVACFTFAAIANPVPNPIPMIIQALILVLLYYCSIGICMIREYLVTRQMTITAACRGFAIRGLERLHIRRPTKA